MNSTANFASRMNSFFVNQHKIMLFILLSVVVLNNLVWHVLGGSPLHWDASVHLYESLVASRVVTTAGVPLKELLYSSWYYPPFVSWISIPFYSIFGEGMFVALWVMTGFLVILVLSTYGIGESLFDANVGLLGAIFLSFFPIVQDCSRQFMLDMPLASMSALSLYLLIKTENYKQESSSYLLGLALACGFLTKWTFPFFLILPLLYVGFVSLRIQPERRRRIKNMMASFAIAFVVSLPWYFVHILPILAGRTSQLAEGNRPLLQSLTYYLQILPQQTSWLLFLALLAGIFVYVRQNRFAHLVPILSFLGGFLLLTIINFKMPRFSIPLLPPLTVLACGGIVGWVEQGGVVHAKRMWAVIIFSMFILFQGLLSSYVSSDSALGRIISRAILNASIIPVQGPQEHNWQQLNILRTVADDASKKNKPTVILRVIPDHLYFNWQSFEYLAALNRLPVSISTISGFPLFTDYAVLKTGNLGEDVAQRQRITDLITADTALFEFVKSFPLPDGSDALLMRVRVRPKTDSPTDTIEAYLRQTTDQFIKRYLKPLEGYSIYVRTTEKDDLQWGRVHSLRVRSERAEFGDFSFNPVGISVSDVDIELTNVLFDPTNLIAHHSLQILSLQGLNIRGFQISALDLQDYLLRSSKGKIIVHEVKLENGMISLSITPQKLGLTIDAALRLQTVENKNLIFSIQNLKIGGVPISPTLMNGLLSSYNPLLNSLKTVSMVRIGTFTILDGHLRILDTEGDE
jgi:hypothetical protein